MARTMKAAVVRAFDEPLGIDEVPVPEVSYGMIQVAIQASGVCHTDLHAAEGDWPVKPKPPFIPGHEGVGFVSAVGKGVRHIKEGDQSACRGSTPLAGTAYIVWAGGRRRNGQEPYRVEAAMAANTAAERSFGHHDHPAQCRPC